MKGVNWEGENKGVGRLVRRRMLLFSRKEIVAVWTCVIPVNPENRGEIRDKCVNSWHKDQCLKDFNMCAKCGL